MNPLWTILFSFGGAIACLLVPASRAREARWAALVASVGGLLAAVGSAAAYGQGRVWRLDAGWIPEVGARFHLAAPGIAIALLLLTAIVAVAGVLYSWNVEKQPRAFFALFLIIIGSVYGVFLSRDALLLFFFYEMVILPKYFLIARWGGKDREYGAMKLTLYSIGSSALVIAGLGLAWAAAGKFSFDLADLASATPALPVQWVGFPLLAVGFGVLAGLWPFHTWAPTGHVAAPTAASMLLAGVVMKLGAFGILMVAIPLFPEGFAIWAPALAVLAVAGILHGAFTAYTKRDLKFVIAYSSVSHMGFVLLGLASGNRWGTGGAVLQMISHGLIAGLLFGLAGRVVYDRVHVRDFEALEKENLWNRLRWGAVAFIVASAASMGLPGFSGFAAELSVILGVWSAFPWLVAPVVLGVIVTGAFSLRAIQKGFLPAREKRAASSTTPLPPLTWPEISATLLLLMASLAIGLYPAPWWAWVLDGLHHSLAP